MSAEDNNIIIGGLQMRLRSEHHTQWSYPGTHQCLQPGNQPSADPEALSLVEKLQTVPASWPPGHDSYLAIAIHNVKLSRTMQQQNFRKFQIFWNLLDSIVHAHQEATQELSAGAAEVDVSHVTKYNLSSKNASTHKARVRFNLLVATCSTYRYRTSKMLCSVDEAKTESTIRCCCCRSCCWRRCNGGTQKAVFALDWWRGVWQGTMLQSLLRFLCTTSALLARTPGQTLCSPCALWLKTSILRMSPSQSRHMLCCNTSGPSNHRIVTEHHHSCFVSDAISSLQFTSHVTSSLCMLLHMKEA